MQGVLDGIRVLDLAGEPGFLAGKLLGHLGADVVKIEPPNGDPARYQGPYWGHVEDPERSLRWIAFNDSKRGITLDLGRPAGRELFLRLCERADVVLETTLPGRLAELGLDWPVLHGRQPRLILCSLTPYGRSGPHARWRGSDLTVIARSGNLHCTGDPDRPPVRCSLPVSYFHGSLEACVGIAFALLDRERSGLGQHVDVALHEAMVMPNIGTASMARMTGHRGARSGAFLRQRHSVQREIWPCRDGWVSFALRGGPARVPGLVALVRWMAEEGMASEDLQRMDWTTYNHNLVGQEEVDALSAEFAAFFATKTMTELFEAACARNLMLAPANTAREVLQSEQLAARRFFVDVEHPGRGTLRLPRTFALVTSASPDATAIALRRPAPRLGEHTAEVLAELGFDADAVRALVREGVV